jgi:hypothetical protein
VRRVLTVVAAVATLVGLPAVLVAGTLLRHVGHVAPSVTNVVELRLRIIGHGVPCDDPKPDALLTEPRDDPRSALRCPGPPPLRLVAYDNEDDRKAAAVPAPSWVVEGANWRVYTVTDEALAHRLARALTGRARYRVR